MSLLQLLMEMQNEKEYEKHAFQSLSKDRN